MEVGQSLGQIVDGHEQQMLDRPGRGLDGGGGERRLVAGRIDDAVDAGRFGGSQERAEVLGILERVENQGEGRLLALDRPGKEIVDRGEPAAVGDERDALVAVEAGQGGEGATLDFDDWDAQARGVQDELL